MHLRQTPTTFTTLYQAWRAGNEDAREELVRLVYQQLHLLASNYLSREPLTPSLQTTELIHETWLRLFGHEAPDFENRAHFFVIAARQMRRILIDRARGALAERRIPKTHLLPISEAKGVAIEPDEYLLALDEALQQLESTMPRAAQVVELRYFAGLTEEQTALILGISVTTVKRDWAFAKLWLYDRLTVAE
jgi:RNA polymerase sigma-70 factor, ECF subfamily